MKKFMQKLAVAALSLSVLSACQGEENMAMIMMRQRLQKPQWQHQHQWR